MMLIKQRNSQRTRMEKIQRNAWAALITISLMLFVIMLIIANVGVENYFQDDSLRAQILLVILGSWIVYFLITLLSDFRVSFLLKGRKTPKIKLDERDKDIIRKATRFQVLTMTLALMGWSVGLTEFFWEEGAVPIGYLYLMAISILFISMAGQSLGIIFGYRKFR